MTIIVENEAPAFAAHKMRSALVRCSIIEGLALRHSSYHDVAHSSGLLLGRVILTSHARRVWGRNLTSTNFSAFGWWWLDSKKISAPENFSTWKEYESHVSDPINLFRRWLVTFSVAKLFVQQDKLEAITNKRSLE